MKAVRKAVGDGTRIRVDGNQGYDRATAMWVFSRMEEMGLEWIEQPLPHWDLEGLQALCRRLDTPVAVDESVHTPEDAMRVIRTGAADVVNIKVTKCGGIDRSQKIAAICAAAGVPCYVGGCIETHPGRGGFGSLLRGDTQHRLLCRASRGVGLCGRRRGGASHGVGRSHRGAQGARPGSDGGRGESGTVSGVFVTRRVLRTKKVRDRGLKTEACPTLISVS